MPQFQMRLEGGPELLEAFSKLRVDVQEKVAARALDKGAEFIRHEAQRRAPVLTGLTRDAIRVERIGKVGRGGFLTYYVVVGEGNYFGKTFYAAFVEFGHFQGARRKSFKATSKREARKLRMAARAEKKLAKKGTKERDEQEADFTQRGIDTALESGGERKFIAARPFMRPAFDENREAVVNKVLDDLKKGIDEIWGSAQTGGLS